ncbi:MAG: hypothetical protein HYZ86_04625, partial [Candidatus Omnitrophica bacterium]|nr:hypothetical protein [Candidatus Omnitrophota bacterium]
MRTSLKQEKLPDATLLNYAPLPGSRKVYQNGCLYKDVRVPFREVALSLNNAPLRLYDTSGPYTDPLVKVDITRGLPSLRRDWILGRGDVEYLAEPTSHDRKQRDNDLDLAAIRFPGIRKPLRAKTGANVTQMHYARRGITTPEMEFIALREGCDPEF